MAAMQNRQWMRGNKGEVVGEIRKKAGEKERIFSPRWK